MKRVYFRDRVDVEKLYSEARNAGEVKDMLSKNVERWIEEWKAEGEAKGRAEGDAKLLEVAKKLLAAGMSVSQICEITSLSREEVQERFESTAH